MKNNNKIYSMLWEELLCGKGPCCGKQQQNKFMLLEELQCRKGHAAKKQQQNKFHAFGGATVWEGAML